MHNDHGCNAIRLKKNGSFFKASSQHASNPAVVTTGTLINQWYKKTDLKI